MATKSKKKVKTTTTKQKQKQAQKQNVVVNVNTTSKKSTKKKKQSQSQPTNRPLRPTAETAYNRVITQSQPMLIQHIPNNNDLIGAIQQIANKFQQPSAPVQYNPALMEDTLKGIKELNEAIRLSDNQNIPQPQPLKEFTNKPPEGLKRPVPKSKIDTPLSISPPPPPKKPHNKKKFTTQEIRPYMNITHSGVKHDIGKMFDEARVKVLNPKTGRLIFKAGSTAKKIEKAGIPLHPPSTDSIY